MTESRLTEIETRLAYAEYNVAELSDLVYAQSQAIDALTKQCQRLQQRMTALAEPDDKQPSPEDEIPPHY